ncbi:MAG: hypothetical protein RL272_958 [Candidatus Parcubacteria bacterium]|jgi:glycosyltransferase involved in cell wall biosynthesis
MKIVFASNLYGEYARGGAERIVEREATALASLGHDVAVVSAERPRAIPKGVCLPGEPWLCPPPGGAAAVRKAYEAAIRRAAKQGEPRVIRYAPPNIYFYPDGLEHGVAARFAWHLLDIANAKSARTFGAIVDLESPDVVHTHNLMGLGFLIPAALRRRRIRHVHTVHDVQLLHPSGLIMPAGARPWPSRIAQAAYVRVMRATFGSPDVVVFPTRYLMDLHVRAGFFTRSEKVVLPNPSPAVAALPRAAAPGPRFLFAGQIEAHKGISLLLDSWEDAHIAGGTLTVIGGGSREAEVRARAASLAGVEVTGRQDAAAVEAAYGRAAFTVVPSLVIENAPTVILESLSCGTPVIAAATGGIGELVEDGVTGRLFAPGDRQGLAAALRDAARLEGWEAMSAAAVSGAARNGIVPHAQALLGLYRAGA